MVRAQAVLIPQVGESRLEFEQRLAQVAGRPVSLTRGGRPARDTKVLSDGVGQFFVGVSIAGTPITMLVDTGATVVALSYEDATRLGMQPEAMAFDRSMETANGTIRAAGTVLPMVSVGEIDVSNVEAIVLPRGSTTRSLLGMSFLSRLRRMEIL